MANPRQRRKAKSGTAKVKQSRRQQDKLKKVVVKGPASLIGEYDKTLTPRQNYERLGLLKRPMALRQSGGIEKELVPRSAIPPSAADFEDSDSDGEDSDNADGVHMSDTQEAGPAMSQAHSKAPRPQHLTSKDIPKGFARIERDAQGNVLRVIMSAHDEPGQADGEEGDEKMGDSNETSKQTPWGMPLNDENEEKRQKERHQPIIAKNAAIRELEARTREEQRVTASSKRFSSPGEAEYLRNLVQKYGTDIDAMAKDFRLNTDQRTAGQLKKAFKRCGGPEKFMV